MLQRRTILRDITARCATLLLGGFATPVLSQSKLAPQLRIVIPASSRSSLDVFGRAIGDALVGTGLTDEIVYENREGLGATAALSYFVQHFGNDPNAFFMADTSFAGALAVQQSSTDLTQLQAVARIVSEYAAVVVNAASPLKTMAELTERLRTAQKTTPIASGASGSVEHVLAGRLQKAGNGKPEDGVYLHPSRRFEMVDAVLTGKAMVGIGNYSVFQDELASGKLRALGIASQRSGNGLRSLREQGLDMDAANGSSVFMGKALTADYQTKVVTALRTAMTYELWKKTVKQNAWALPWLTGTDLAQTIELEMKTARLMVQLLKLKA